MKPVRIQRKRTKGWKMPPNTVSVTRPGIWGNPFNMNTSWYTAAGQFRQRMEDFKTNNPKGFEDFIAPLRGKNLACWCKPGAACHADVLLELANADRDGEQG